MLPRDRGGTGLGRQEDLLRPVLAGWKKEQRGGDAARAGVEGAPKRVLVELVRRERHVRERERDNRRHDDKSERRGEDRGKTVRGRGLVLLRDCTFAIALGCGGCCC